MGQCTWNEAAYGEERDMVWGGKGYVYGEERDMCMGRNGICVCVWGKMG